MADEAAMLEAAGVFDEDDGNTKVSPNNVKDEVTTNTSVTTTTETTSDTEIKKTANNTITTASDSNNNEEDTIKNVKAPPAPVKNAGQLAQEKHSEEYTKEFEEIKFGKNSPKEPFWPCIIYSPSIAPVKNPAYIKWINMPTILISVY